MKPSTNLYSMIGAAAVALLSLAPTALAKAPAAKANAVNVGTLGKDAAKSEKKILDAAVVFANAANKQSPAAQAALKVLKAELKFLRQLVEKLPPTDSRGDIYKQLVEDMQIEVDNAQASAANPKKINKIIEKANKLIATGNQIFPNDQVSPLG